MRLNRIYRRAPARAAWLAAALLCPAAALAEAPPPPPLEAYGDLPDVEDMALSPSGQGIAMVGKVRNQRVLVVTGPGNVVRRSMKLGTLKTRGINWAGDDIVYLSSSSTTDLGIEFTADKLEFFTINLIDVNRPGSEIKQAFDKEPHIPDAVFGNHGVRQVGGRWLGYFGALEFSKTLGTNYIFEHGRPFLYALDLADGSARRVANAAPPGNSRDWLVDGAGEVVVTRDIEASDGGWSIRNARNAAIASGTDPRGRVYLTSLGRDGTSVIYSAVDSSRPDSPQKRWYEVPLAGGPATEVFADIDIARFYVDSRNSRLLGYLPGDDAARPVLFDPAAQAALRKVYRAFARFDVAVFDWTPDFSHLMVHASGNGNSGTWYLVEVAALKAEIVGYDRPAITPDQVGAISTFAYTAGDGLDLDGVLTLPPGREARNLPVVILPHGGPNTHDTESFDWWAQAFASRGYAVFQPNFRGSTNRDMAFRNAGYGQWGRKMQTDLSDGLAALAKQGIVDPARACIMGASYGGYAALAGATVQSGVYRCAVAVAPVSDLADMARTDLAESGDSRMMQATLRETLGDPAGFAAVSPRRHAAAADAPILLIHGKDDTVVPFGHTSAMADALKDAGKPHEVVVLAEEDHWLSRAATRQQMLQAAMRFVQQHNPAD